MESEATLKAVIDRQHYRLELFRKCTEILKDCEDNFEDDPPYKNEGGEQFNKRAGETAILLSCCVSALSSSVTVSPYVISIFHSFSLTPACLLSNLL